jgi:hypothetical protein
VPAPKKEQTPPGVPTVTVPPAAHTTAADDEAKAARLREQTASDAVRVRALVEAQPGLTRGGISTALALGWQRVRDAVEYLGDAVCVVRERHGTATYHRHYPAPVERPRLQSSHVKPRAAA